MTGRHAAPRNWGARIRQLTAGGLPLLVLENELLRVSVLTGRGSDIIEFLYKPRDIDLVWLSPVGVAAPTPPAGADPLGAFLDQYPGGWQEMLPNTGDPCTALGASFRQHDEVCYLPWDYTITSDEPEQVSIELTVHTRKTPLTVNKTLTMHRRTSTLHIAETVTNHSPTATVPITWGQHLAFGPPFLQPGCTIDVPGSVTIFTDGLQRDPRGHRIQPHTKHDWPFATSPSGEPVDLSVLPPPGTPAEMAYLTDLAEGRYRITNPHLGMCADITWDLDVMPYLWYWSEPAATHVYPWWGRAYLLGLEPCTSHPTFGLAAAIDNGTALTLPPGGRHTFNHTITATDGPK